MNQVRTYFLLLTCLGVLWFDWCELSLISELELLMSPSIWGVFFFRILRFYTIRSLRNISGMIFKTLLSVSVFTLYLVEVLIGLNAIYWISKEGSDIFFEILMFQLILCTYFLRISFEFEQSMLTKDTKYVKAKFQ